MPMQTRQKRLRRELASDEIEIHVDAPGPSARTTQIIAEQQATNVTVDERLSNLTNIVQSLVGVVGATVNTTTSDTSNSKLWNKTDLIPCFDPEKIESCIEKWIVKIEEYQRVYRWTDEVTKHHALTKLSGVAKRWYDSLPYIEYTWPEWKEILRKAFPSQRDYCHLLKTMLARKKSNHETYMRYYYDKITLLNVVEISGRNAVSCIIDGLHETNIKSNAQAGKFDSPEAILVFLKTQENTFAGVDLKSSSFRPQRQNTRPSVSRNFQAQTSTTIECFKYHQNGHRARNCPNNQPSGANKSIKCNFCNKIGHIEANCYSKQNKQRRTSSITSSTLLINNKERNLKYFKDVYLNEIPMKAYIDMGSSCTIIRESDARKCRLDINENCKTVISSYGGTTMTTLGTTKFVLRIDNVERTVRANVVADHIQDIAILVGQSFTDAEGVVVIKDEHQICFKNGLLERDKINKIPLWAVESTVIPKNYGGFITVRTKENIHGDCFVESSLRIKEGAEYLVPSGLIRLSKENEAVIPIINLSDFDLTITTKFPLVRAVTCQEKNKVDDFVNKIHEKKLTPLKFEELKVGLTDENIRTRLNNLIIKYRHCFANDHDEMGKAESTEMDIKLNDDTPFMYRPYRMSHEEKEQVKNIIDDLLKTKIIQESESEYASPVLLVKKKNGKPRMCVDFRKLNSKTIKERFPLPQTDDQIDQLHGMKYFATLDLFSGYHQVRLSERSRRLTSFVVPEGQFEYLRMPFGLCNAPSVFQRLMNKVFGVHKGLVAIYLDDLLISSQDIEEHFTKLETTLKILEKEGLTLNPTKCHFFSTKITYHRFEITREPNAEKTLAVERFEAPKNVKQVRQFLGLTGYFRKFIPNYGLIAKTLTLLTKKNIKFHWGKDEELAFNTLKSHLITKPVLAIYDPNAETQVHCDACQDGLAGILFQKGNDKWNPVFYYSVQTSIAESKYPSYELETLAVVKSLEKFRVYLLGKPFKVVTDCNALTTANSKKDLVPRLARWWLTLQEFEFTVEHRPGLKMAHVDALSRNAVTLQIEPADWILSAQFTDDKVKLIHKILHKTPTTDYEKKIHDEYCLRNNRIYRQTANGIQWLVPKGMRQEVVRYAHDEMGHFSVEKTLKKLTETYWFPKMRSYVERYIKCCVPCLFAKSQSGKKAGLLNPIEKIPVPFHTVHIDHLGPFIRSTSRNEYLIVLVDAFTKFVLLKAVKSTRVCFVIAFLKQCFSIYGTPSRIIDDRGTYNSKEFKKFCEENGSKQIMNAVATPRANGQVERFNRTVIGSLAASITSTIASYKEPTKWDRGIPKIQFGLNNTVHRTTGKTPSQILMGYTPRSQSESVLTNELREIEAVREDLELLRRTVKQRLDEDQRKAKIAFDKKRKQPKKFKEDDLVLIQKNSSSTGSSRKLLPKFSGPMVVRKVLPRDRYYVEDLPNSTRSLGKPYRNVTAIDRMRAWVPPKAMSSDSESETLN